MNPIVAIVHILSAISILCFMAVKDEKFRFGILVCFLVGLILSPYIHLNKFIMSIMDRKYGLPADYKNLRH